MNQRKIVTIGIVSNFLGLIAKKLSTLMITVLLVRELAVEDFGAYSLFLASIVLLGSISLGFDKIIQRYFPEILRRDKASALSFFLLFYLQRIAVAFGLALLAYILTNMGVLDASRFEIDGSSLILSAGALFATCIVCQVTLNAAFFEHAFINTAKSLCDFGKLACLLLLWDGVMFDAVLIWVGGEIIFTLLLAARLIYRVKPSVNLLDYRGSVADLEFSRYYHYGKYLIFASTGTYILSAEIDYFFLSYYVDNAAVGYYSFSSKLALLSLELIPSALMFNVLMPLLFKRIDSGESIEDVKHLLVTFSKLNFVIWTIFSSFAFINIWLIVGVVFDEKYFAAVPYACAWFVILYPLVIKNIFEPVARALEFSKIYLVTALSAVINVVGNALLIPVFGIEGAVISTGIALVAQGLLITLMVWLKISLRIRPRIFLIFVAKASFLLVACYLATTYFQFRTLLELLLANSLLAVTIAMLFWPTKIFSASEIAYIVSYMPSRFRSWLRVG